MDIFIEYQVHNVLFGIIFSEVLTSLLIVLRTSNSSPTRVSWKTVNYFLILQISTVFSSYFSWRIVVDINCGIIFVIPSQEVVSLGFSFGGDAAPGW